MSLERLVCMIRQNPHKDDSKEISQSPLERGRGEIKFRVGFKKVRFEGFSFDRIS